MPRLPAVRTEPLPLALSLSLLPNLLLLRRRLLAALLLSGAGLLAGCQSPGPSPSQSPPPSAVVTAAQVAPAPGLISAPAPVPAAGAELRRTLAPTGALRIAVYPGSPTSLVRRAGSDEARGVSVDIGRELALNLGVPAQLVEFQRVEQVIDALVAGEADMTVTNATAVRATRVDFTEPLVALELGFLAAPGSALASMAEVDRPGIRVGVSQGSSSQGVLGSRLRQATVVPVPSLAAAAEMLKDGRLDAFATNKGILFQLADGVPGARMLEGRWGTESLAIAVPKGREGGREFLARFAASARSSGLVRRAAERAGLRGLAEPEAR